MKPLPHSLKNRGFTLLELLVALAVLVILAGVAVPGFQNFTADQRVKSAAQSLYASLLYARTEALKRNDVVYVHPNGGGAGDWDQGWLVTDDPNQTSMDCTDAAADADLLQTHCDVRGTGVTFAAGAPTRVAYGGDGRADPASFLLCGADIQRPRTVSVALGGLPQIAQEGNCP